MGKILVVDDDEMNLTMIGHALGKAGHEVITQHSGLCALAYLRDESADICLLDIEMPGMNGYICLDIMTDEGYMKPEDVAFMTATIDDEVLERKEQMGVLQCIKKPFLPDELTQIVAEMLEHKGV